MVKWKIVSKNYDGFDLSDPDLPFIMHELNIDEYQEDIDEVIETENLHFYADEKLDKTTKKMLREIFCCSFYIEPEKHVVVLLD